MGMRLNTTAVASQASLWFRCCLVPLSLPVAVFSAPKYCDSTENKGAYINVKSDYKLDYHQFDAVPHPDIKVSRAQVRLDCLFN